MPTLTSQLNPRSDAFKAASTLMRQLVGDLGARLDQIAQGGGEAARAKHVARGKLLPRERVEMLLDPDTPFLELAPLAALDMYDNAAPGAGIAITAGFEFDVPVRFDTDVLDVTLDIERLGSITSIPLLEIRR